MSKHRAALALVAAGALVVPACGCTAVLPIEGLIVEVTVTGGPLPAGDYAIIAQVDGVKIRVDETLNADGSVSAWPADDVIVDGKTLHLDAAVFATWGTITISYREGGGPPMVSIEILRGTDVVAEEAYAPTYAEFQPNGNDLVCGPGAQQAHGTLSIAAP